MKLKNYHFGFVFGKVVRPINSFFFNFLTFPTVNAYMINSVSFLLSRNLFALKKFEGNERGRWVALFAYLYMIKTIRLHSRWLVPKWQSQRSMHSGRRRENCTFLSKLAIVLSTCKQCRISLGNLRVKKSYIDHPWFIITKILMKEKSSNWLPIYYVCNIFLIPNVPLEIS